MLASDPEVGVVLALQDQPADLPDDAAAQWRDTLEGDVRGVTAAGVPLVIASTLPDHRPDREGALGGLRAGLLAAAAVVAALPTDGGHLRAIAAAAIRAGGPATEVHLAESDGKTVLREAGVTVPDFVVARDADGAAVVLRTSSGAASSSRPRTPTCCTRATSAPSSSVSTTPRACVRLPSRCSRPVRRVPWSSSSGWPSPGSSSSSRLTVTGSCRCSSWAWAASGPRSSTTSR